MILFIDFVVKRDCSFADSIMQIGFKYAAIAGISFGKDDLLSQMKNKNYSMRPIESSEYESQYQDGLITQGENATK